jgi:hypothetical protein
LPHAACLQLLACTLSHLCFCHQPRTSPLLPVPFFPAPPNLNTIQTAQQQQQPQPAFVNLVPHAPHLLLLLLRLSPPPHLRFWPWRISRRDGRRGQGSGGWEAGTGTEKGGRMEKPKCSTDLSPLPPQDQGPISLRFKSSFHTILEAILRGLIYVTLWDISFSSYMMR